MFGSSSVLFPDKPEQVHRKLEKESGRHQATGNVRQEHGRILYHLENARLIVVIEACLVKGVAAITKRAVHRDADVAMLIPLEVFEADLTREIIRDIGSGITIMIEMKKGEREL